jgi:hypothetical protein
MRRFPAALLGLSLLAGGCPGWPPPGAVLVESRPPHELVEAVPVGPGAGYVWIRGFWRWDRRDFVWERGRWLMIERGYRSWVPGRWVHSRSGWYWVGGHWR